jgi:hypothetical protein
VLFDSADILAALPDFFPRSEAIDRLSGVGPLRWQADSKKVSEILGLWFTNCVKTTPATLIEERDPDLKELRRQKVDKVFDWSLECRKQGCFSRFSDIEGSDESHLWPIYYVFLSLVRHT